MLVADAAVAFAGFFDDAALFPPARLPMVEAVAAHVSRLRSGDHRGATLGPLVLDLRRSSEFARAANGRQCPIAVSAICDVETVETADRHLARISALDGVHIKSTEYPPASRHLADKWILSDRPCERYVELDWQSMSLDAVHELSQQGHRAKFRTGGLSASAFPPSDLLSVGLAACTAERVPFKCTAGLHSAIRHDDPVTGFEHHGFLNILTAIIDLLTGASGPEVIDRLEERDGMSLAVALLSSPAAVLVEARSLFISIGTCNIDEPWADLATLGLFG
ncbi:MAG: hypothetical protein ACYCVN_11745 [Acidimicrobiales bacterium]